LQRRFNQYISGCGLAGLLLLSRPCSCACSCVSPAEADGFLISAPSYVRLRNPPASSSNNFHVDPISLHSSCFYASQHPSDHRLFSSINNSQDHSQKPEHICPATDKTCQPAMYHRNSHQTDICLELLLTAQVTFR
jgi:hypothetical protein